MADSTEKPRLFQGKTVSFEAILSGRAAGGPAALALYCDTRIAQISRRLATPAEDPAEHATSLAALAAFKAARQLLPLMTRQIMERRLADAAQLAASARQAARR
ncbi:MAG: hypothetical protein ACRC14_12615 [Paracoccaceae bacterium]